MTYAGPALPLAYPVCKEDFAIWDQVLKRWPLYCGRAGGLETMSRDSDRRDAATIRWREKYRYGVSLGRLVRIAPPDALDAAMRVEALGPHWWLT
jgi:hypothetical protein